MGHLGQRPHRRYDVHHLKPRLLAAQDTFLTRDHHHRHRAELGKCRARRQIERARAKGRQTHSGLSGQPAMCGCHESGCLFVASQHQLDARVTQRFDDVEILLPGDPEDLLDTLVLQRGDQQLSSIHDSSSSPPGKLLHVRETHGFLQIGSGILTHDTIAV